MHAEDTYHSTENLRLEEPARGHAALRLGRRSLPNHAYFLTKCADDRTFKSLHESRCAMCIVESLRWLGGHRFARCCGFVIMPDHYHVVLGLYESKSLAEVMASLNRFTSRQINGIIGRTGKFWEAAYYDHAIRDQKDFEGILQYMHENPVRAGLAAIVEDWPVSTAHPQFGSMIDWKWLGPLVE